MLSLQVYADVYDTMVFGDASEIVDKFQKLERKVGSSIVLNAESSCYAVPESLCVDYPASPTRWRYLNSGIVVGRVSALRHLLKEPDFQTLRGE